MKPERTKEEILKPFVKMNWPHEYAENGMVSRKDALLAMEEYKSQSSPVESKWVSVEERPNNGELVLLANVVDGWVVAGCRLGKHYWNQFQQGTDEPTIYPTHWQPLPLPPIEETKEK